jgi:hypothetical protein
MHLRRWLSHSGLFIQHSTNRKFLSSVLLLPFERFFFLLFVADYFFASFDFSSSVFLSSSSTFRRFRA